MRTDEERQFVPWSKILAFGPSLFSIRALAATAHRALFSSLTTFQMSTTTHLTAVNTAHLEALRIIESDSVDFQWMRLDDVSNVDEDGNWRMDLNTRMFLTLTNLTTLTLVKCEDKVNGRVDMLFLQGCPSLTSLDLSLTCTWNLPLSLPCLINLQHLTLRGCMRYDIGRFSQFPTFPLITLNLSFSRFDTLDLEWLSGIVTLEYLDLSGCLCCNFDGLSMLSIGPLTRMRTLLLSGCNISLTGLQQLADTYSVSQQFHRLDIVDCNVLSDPQYTAQLTLFRPGVVRTCGLCADIVCSCSNSRSMYNSIYSVCTSSHRSGCVCEHCAIYIRSYIRSNNLL
jgi:hypothetical protein